MKCNICAEVYGIESELVILEKRESLLGMGMVYTLGCEQCGAIISNVKIAKENIEEFEKMFAGGEE